MSREGNYSVIIYIHRYADIQINKQTDKKTDRHNLDFILCQMSFDFLDAFLILFLSSIDDFIFESIKLLSSLSVCEVNTVLAILLNKFVKVLRFHDKMS
jgi:hypothetical protein